MEGTLFGQTRDANASYPQLSATYTASANGTIIAMFSSASASSIGRPAPAWQPRQSTDRPGVARAMSQAPARIAGLADHGQPLAAGSPANLTLVDPTAEVTVDRSASRSLSRNNPWHGRTLRGAVHATVLRGRVCRTST